MMAMAPHCHARSVLSKPIEIALKAKSKAPMKQNLTAARSEGLKGRIRVPGDKSISHRALILGALATGRTRIAGLLEADDVLATAKAVAALGAEIFKENGAYVVQGEGVGGLRTPDAPLDFGNSGTGSRLMLGVVAGNDVIAEFTGDASLCRRPMDRVLAPLKKMGLAIEGQSERTNLPLRVRGTSDLIPIEYASPVPSAQVKSAVLLAGLHAPGRTTVIEKLPTRDHTERMLLAMGADVRFGEGPFARIAPLRGELAAMSLRVPGDISSAAPWLVLGAIHPDAEIHIRGVCVNATRTGILDALSMMGADVHLEEERTWGAEPVADIVVRSSKLRGAVIEGALVPRAIDELPLLALAGCFARGETVIRDAAELRVKESDRIRTTVANLRRMGAKIEETADGMRVRGGQRLNGASISSSGDHRLAVMSGIAGMVAGGETVVRNSSAIAVSYPRFWEDTRAVSARK